MQESFVAKGTNAWLSTLTLLVFLPPLLCHVTNSDSLSVTVVDVTNNNHALQPFDGTGSRLSNQTSGSFLKSFKHLWYRRVFPRQSLNHHPCIPPSSSTHTLIISRPSPIDPPYIRHRSPMDQAWISHGSFITAYPNRPLSALFILFRHYLVQPGIIRPLRSLFGNH